MKLVGRCHDGIEILISTVAISDAHRISSYSQQLHYTRGCKSQFLPYNIPLFTKVT